MNIQQIFEKYYQPGTPLYNSVWSHSKLVAEKALKLAQAHPELNIERFFLVGSRFRIKLVGEANEFFFETYRAHVTAL